MPRTITEQSFYRYITCPHWVWFDAHAAERRVHEPLMAALQDDGLVEEKQREILATYRDIAEVTAEDEQESFYQTLAFMRDGRQTIYHGALVDGHWVGHPDILQRVEGRSLLGNYYYIAADIKRARSLRDDFKFQGCFYAELLQKVQGVKPFQGYVITPEGKTLPYLIEHFEREYALTLDGIERIVSGIRPAHFLTSGCKQSPWFKECRGQTHACNDLSLLNRVWREEVAQLESIGIRTVDALAKLAVHDIKKRLPDADIERLELLRDQAIAIAEHRHIVRGRIVFPASDVELFFDIESDPLRDMDYLFGVLVVEHGTGTYHRFFAESSAREEAMWREFLACIERYPQAPIYHYGGFEQEVVRRFADRFGSPAPVRQALVSNMRDLLAMIRPAVLFPLSFYSLKDIARYLGFSWRAEDAGGANSVLWFEQWLRTKDPTLLEKICAYNEDDVRATHVVQAWVKTHAG